MQDELTVDIEVEVSAELNRRRFRWCLKGMSEDNRPSPESFATRREAMQAGQIALDRALGRGRSHRPSSTLA